MMYSFDVFNTLIGRKTITPDGVFYIMQERMMASSYYRESVGINRILQFANYRRTAEEINAKSKVFPVTHIDQIYKILFYMMGSVSMELIEKIKELEVDTECHLAFAIEKNINKINELLKNKKKVILISDMYLSSDNIREILLPLDEKIANLPIYVSSEWNCTKRDGGLYQSVKANEKANFANWVHIGDDEIGDVLVPDALGIKTEKYANEKRIDIEDYVVNDLRNNRNLSCLGIGLAQSLRCRNGWNSYESIGGYVGGAFIFSYVLWVVEEALKFRFNRLLFVSRDGYILKSVADIIIGERGYEISTDYVYGSRKAWRTLDGKRKENAVAYIRSFIGDERCAFVDLQSSGASMDILLEDVNDISDIPYFIYGFDQNRKLKKVRPIIYDEVNRGISMEVFCRAPHGVTEGYEIRNREVVPILGEWKDDWEWNHQDEFAKGLFEYTIEMIRLLDKLGINGSWKEYNECICVYINNMSDMTLNSYIGNITHDSGEDDKEGKYAPLLTENDINQIAAYGQEIFRSKYYLGANFELSLKRTGKAINDFDATQIEYYNNLVENRKKKRILLYTAGKQGKKYYRILKGLKDIEVVGWSDLRAEEYKREGLLVISIKDAMDLDRDYILIPMKKNGYSYKNIVTFLRNVGFEDVLLSEDDISEYIYSVISGGSKRDLV